MKLVIPNIKLKEAYEDFVQDWQNHNEKIIPYSASPRDMDFDALLESWEKEPTDLAYQNNFVPSQLYFLVADKRILGAIHLRHELNDTLLKMGGHIGYGVRPSERKKGYVFWMMSAIIAEVKKLNIKRLLLICDADNIPSQKTIIKCGGHLENQTIENEKLINRYWIDIEG